MKLWGGRFQKETNQMVDDFHSSISFDRRLFPQDIRGSMAHARMLCRQGIISPEDESAIRAGDELSLALKLSHGCFVKKGSTAGWYLGRYKMDGEAKEP